jgi:hypothetical protein
MLGSEISVCLKLDTQQYYIPRQRDQDKAGPRRAPPGWFTRVVHPGSGLRDETSRPPGPPGWFWREKSGVGKDEILVFISYGQS